jgi:hypothetical protein
MSDGLDWFRLSQGSVELLLTMGHTDMPLTRVAVALTADLGAYLVKAGLDGVHNDPI